MKITNFLFVLLATTSITLLGGIPTEDTYIQEYNPSMEVQDEVD